MLSSIYNKDVRSSSFRAIILVRVEQAKLTCYAPCPPPVHVDSFDPGGTQSLDDAIARGTVFADTRLEVDNPRCLQHLISSTESSTEEKQQVILRR
jgi:hypothetical protein